MSRLCTGVHRVAAVQFHRESHSCYCALFPCGKETKQKCLKWVEEVVSLMNQLSVESSLRIERPIHKIIPLHRCSVRIELSLLCPPTQRIVFVASVTHKWTVNPTKASPFQCWYVDVRGPTDPGITCNYFQGMSKASTTELLENRFSTKQLTLVDNLVKQRPHLPYNQWGTDQLKAVQPEDFERLVDYLNQIILVSQKLDCGLKFRLYLLPELNPGAFASDTLASLHNQQRWVYTWILSGKNGENEYPIFGYLLGSPSRGVFFCLEEETIK